MKVAPFKSESHRQGSGVQRPLKAIHESLPSSHHNCARTCAEQGVGSRFYRRTRHNLTLIQLISHLASLPPDTAITPSPRLEKGAAANEHDRHHTLTFPSR